MKYSDTERLLDVHYGQQTNPPPERGRVPRPGFGVHGILLSAIVLLIIAVIIFSINYRDYDPTRKWELGEEYYYQESSDKFSGEYESLDDPVRFGETKTLKSALTNSVCAIDHYFDTKDDVKDYLPITLTFFAEDSIWLINTNHGSGLSGGGISFTINAETGEISDYKLEE